MWRFRNWKKPSEYFRFQQWRLDMLPASCAGKNVVLAEKI